MDAAGTHDIITAAWITGSLAVVAAIMSGLVVLAVSRKRTDRVEAKIGQKVDDVHRLVDTGNGVTAGQVVYELGSRVKSLGAEVALLGSQYPVILATLRDQGTTLVECRQELRETREVASSTADKMNDHLIEREADAPMVEWIERQMARQPDERASDQTAPTKEQDE